MKPLILFDLEIDFKIVEKVHCKIGHFRKYMYQDMISKFINLKQLNLEQIQLKTKSAKTFYNIFEKKLCCQIRNVWEKTKN